MSKVNKLTCEHACRITATYMYQNRWNEKCEILKLFCQSEVEEIFQITNEAQQAIIFKTLISRVKEISCYTAHRSPAHLGTNSGKIARERGSIVFVRKSASLNFELQWNTIYSVLCIIGHRISVGEVRKHFQCM